MDSVYGSRDILAWTLYHSPNYAFSMAGIGFHIEKEKNI